MERRCFEDEMDFSSLLHQFLIVPSCLEPEQQSSWIILFVNLDWLHAVEISASLAAAHVAGWWRTFMTTTGQMSSSSCSGLHNRFSRLIYLSFIFFVRCLEFIICMFQTLQSLKVHLKRIKLYNIFDSNFQKGWSTKCWGFYFWFFAVKI